MTTFSTYSQPGSLTLLMAARWSSTLYFVILSAPEFLNKNYWLSDNFLYLRESAIKDGNLSFLSKTPLLLYLRWLGEFLKQKELENASLQDKLKGFRRSFLHLQTEGVETLCLVEDNPRPDPLRAGQDVGRTENEGLECLEESQSYIVSWDYWAVTHTGLLLSDLLPAQVGDVLTTARRIQNSPTSNINNYFQIFGLNL